LKNCIGLVSGDCVHMATSHHLCMT
jgi:hypothetical protein